MSDCPPVPPEPRFLALVGFHQRLENGANGAWPFGRPDVGSIYWIAAAILLVIMLLITVWSYVRLLRPTQLGWLHRLQIAAVTVGALGLLVLGCYLLLVGWPGTQLDALWRASATSHAGDSENCLNEVRQLVALQTQMRNALNNRALWGPLGALALFIVGHLPSVFRGAPRPPS